MDILYLLPSQCMYAVCQDRNRGEIYLYKPSFQLTVFYELQKLAEEAKHPSAWNTNHVHLPIVYSTQHSLT